MCYAGACFLDTEPANCRLRIASLSGPSISFMARTQIGARLIDALEMSTNMALHGAWTLVGSYTNSITPDAAHFDSGWTEVLLGIDAPVLPPSEQRFFRLKRTWIQP